MDGSINPMGAKGNQMKFENRWGDQKAKMRPGRGNRICPSW